MNTIKTIVVTATLLAVGYGANIVLNKPIANSGFEPSTLWDSPGFSDLPVQKEPEVDLSGLDAVNSENKNPFAADNTAEVQPMTATGLPPSTPNDSAGMNAFPTTSVPYNGAPAAAPPNAVTGPMTAVAPTTMPPIQPPPSQMTPIPPVAAAADGQLVSHHEPLGGNTSVSFEAAWSAAQQLIQAGDYSEALYSLSMVYNHPTLDSGQRSQLLSLLDPLAGTVVYSNKHLMQSAYVVPAGETLADVAARFDLPAGFVARVNGLNTNQPLTAGQSLKVVQGPFRGELSRSRRELTLFVGPHYAGRFNVAIGRDFPEQLTSLQVVEIAGVRPYVDPTSGQQIPAGAENNPYGGHWIGLATGYGQQANLGLHSVGSAVDASDTRGCISVSNENADDLQAILGVGSQIVILP